MKRRYLYTLLMLMLAVIIAAIAWSERPSGQETSPSGGQPDGLLTRYDHPRPVPPLHFQDAAGRVLTLDDFRGRVLLVNIWATWCTPCRQEMPSLDRLQARLGGPDFQVVAISQDRAGLDAVNEFYKEVGIKHLKRYVDDKVRSLDTLNVVGIPTSILIDRQGRAIGSAIGARQWDSEALIDQITRVAELHPAGQPVSANRKEVAR